MIRPYLGIITNDHKTKGECKIQLSITINVISSKDSDGICTLHTQSNNMEIMMRNETDEILEELFKSLQQKCQEGLDEKMRGSEFVIDIDDLLHCQLQKISLNRCGSYIDSPEWLKNKKAAVNPEK